MHLLICMFLKWSCKTSLSFNDLWNSFTGRVWSSYDCIQIGDNWCTILGFWSSAWTGSDSGTTSLTSKILNVLLWLQIIWQDQWSKFFWADLPNEIHISLGGRQQDFEHQCFKFSCKYKVAAGLQHNSIINVWMLNFYFLCTMNSSVYIISEGNLGIRIGNKTCKKTHSNAHGTMQSFIRF